MSDSHTLIIAEAGVNHNGSVDTAIEMIHAAAKAGVDYVKFQTFHAESLVSANAQKAEYQRNNCKDGGDTQLEMLRKLELSHSDFSMLKDVCRQNGIGFMSTPFDIESADFLASLGMDYWKIPSGEITNLPYLRHIAHLGGKVILSTGMSELKEVEDAVEVLETGGIGRENIWLLHCTTQYPTPYDAVNLRAMDQLASIGCAGIGYSDHTPGITVPVAAVARGAMIIEKHFTLDKSMSGPDHKASLEPAELAAMVTAIRETEQALGSDIKTVTDAERPNIAVARKSIVAARKISKGEKLSDENMTAKRPGTGLNPMLWDMVCGTTAIKDFEKDEPIVLSE